MGRGQEITEKLHAAARGDRDAARDLLPLIYDDLKALARGRLRRLRRGETLTTTDLVHESWLRLIGRGDPGWEGRRHFYGAAARAMRNILIERARSKKALKHGGARKLEVLDEEIPLREPPLADVISVGDALEQLEREHPRPAEVVWLHFFSGLTWEEVADVLSISLTTVERDWRFARAWLQNELGRTEL